MLVRHTAQSTRDGSNEAHRALGRVEVMHLGLCSACESHKIGMRKRLVFCNVVKHENILETPTDTKKHFKRFISFVSFPVFGMLICVGVNFKK